jgi:hypothetical protein
MQPNRYGRCSPDYFSETGQLWGNPLYRWEKRTATDMIGGPNAYNPIKMVDIIRLDHFRGFAALGRRTMDGQRTPCKSFAYISLMLKWAFMRQVHHPDHRCAIATALDEDHPVRTMATRLNLSHPIIMSTNSVIYTGTR